MVTRRERRRHHRERPSGGRIPVRHRTPGDEWEDGEALDIGAGGAFVIDADWPVGAPVELAIDVASRAEPLVLPALVRWAAGDGSVDAEAVVVRGLCGVGVQFVGLDLDVIMELQAHLAALAAPDDELDLDAALEREREAASDDRDVPATD
ncbi:MAG TPA: PilZ domain-containing protein [Kofleriaceae bacterium]|nr:PilZ domain-containing protein [Kofleriaceae bacterium]